MTTSTKQTIGLFGFGVVGEGLYNVLQKSPTTKAIIKSICIKEPQKERSLAKEAFCTDYNTILGDPEVNLVVELISDADEAYKIVKSAMLSGKSVVSGNKKMLANNLEELIEIQNKNGVALLYDASACGSIPVIRNLEEYYDNDLLLSITGILNGSSNYILSKIFNENSSYELALRKAQELGFAEADPTLDVSGQDSLNKLIILATHGFGTIVNPSEVFVLGIDKLNSFDIRFAKEKGLKIKLIAQATKINGNSFSLLVMPKLVTADDYIFNVEDEYNGVVIQGEFYEKQFMFGKGAGGFPTGSAVLSDITARMHGYKYEYKKRKYFDSPQFTNDVQIKIYLRYKNVIDFEHFDFESIDEKYTSKDYNYVIGTINLKNLHKVQKLISKLDVFVAFVDIPEKV
ncbi:homoserine dehydrogenase [Perlabentimonas gracilis]|uniref:homoserine dehydrogenase n=1 Tax=Perlabentimonas gracilis TaxID=2715279 RepID=UPI00140841CA|nr:homoserine dehydrogenase [Perlabentimonas gracilis]NHB68747.1 homoserine dehydrogenase [Perlabentimonas gracilis]